MNSRWLMSERVTGARSSWGKQRIILAGDPSRRSGCLMCQEWMEAESNRSSSSWSRSSLSRGLPAPPVSHRVVRAKRNHSSIAREAGRNHRRSSCPPPLVPVVTEPRRDYRGAAATRTPTHRRVSEPTGLHPHGRRNTARLVPNAPKYSCFPGYSRGASKRCGGGHKRLSYRMRRGYKPALFAVSKYQHGDYIRD